MENAAREELTRAIVEAYKLFHLLALSTAPPLVPANASEHPDVLAAAAVLNGDGSSSSSCSSGAESVARAAALSLLEPASTADELRANDAHFDVGAYVARIALQPSIVPLVAVDAPQMPAVFRIPEREQKAVAASDSSSSSSSSSGQQQPQQQQQQQQQQQPSVFPPGLVAAEKALAASRAAHEAALEAVAAQVQVHKERFFASHRRLAELVARIERQGQGQGQDAHEQKQNATERQRQEGSSAGSASSAPSSAASASLEDLRAEKDRLLQEIVRKNALLSGLMAKMRSFQQRIHSL